MPLGILSDDEFEQEISNNKSHGQRDIPARIEPLKIGRGEKSETPESARKLIGEMAIEGESVAIIQREFGISPSSISAYKNGATSTASYNQPEPELKEHTNTVRNNIVKRARKKLMHSLNNITEEKLSDCKARDLAGIAKDMSAIIKNMEPEKSAENNGTQFVFLVPPMKKESDYPIIDVND